MSRIALPLLAGLSAAAAFAMPAWSQSVGLASAVNQSAHGALPGGTMRTITIGEDVIFNERVDTDRAGLVQILLKDGTAFTVAPNSSLTIDRFVYDPSSGDAKVAANLTKGVFRFIGGRTSKTPDGVNLATPVGTIGIRGAVVDISLQQEAGAAGVVAHIDMLFGKEVTLHDGKGHVQRIYTPGYSIVVHQGPGGTTAEVVKTPQGFGSQIQQSLVGGPGTHGGSPNLPTDQTVRLSGVPAENSNRSPVVNRPPVPQPRPPGPTDDPVTAIVQTAAVATTRQNVVSSAEEQSAAASPQPPSQQPETASQPPPAPTQEPPPGNEAPPPPVPTTDVGIRMMTSGSLYAGVISNPGAVGLTGGSTEEDQPVTLKVPAGSTLGTGTTTKGNLSLPVYADATFTVHTLTAADGATLNGVPLTGTVYSGSDGFAAYELAINGNSADPLYALAGTPLTDTSVLYNGDVRTYAFTADPIQQIPVPFMRADALGTDYSGAAINDYYVIEPAAGVNALPRMAETWLLIRGTGPSQVSGVGVNVGELWQDTSGALTFASATRASYRAAADQLPHIMTGGIDANAVHAGENQVFGSNGQYMVLNTGNILADDAGDFLSDQGLGQGYVGYGATHVLNLTGETPLDQIEQGNVPLRTFPSLGVVRGFAAGMEEGLRVDGSGYQFPSISGGDPNKVYLSVNGQNNSLGGEIEVGTSSTSLGVAFGDGVRGNDGRGDSMYINDGTFEANRNDSPSRTYLRDLDGYGNVIAEERELAGNHAGTYFVSGDQVRQPNILPPDGRLCQCDFMSWGWWGTYIQGAASADATQADWTSAVHLGTWVVGDIATAAEADTLAGRTGTFDGHALGNVLATVGGTSYNYIAGGDMHASWDFGARQGSMSVSNFDGRNFNGTISGQAGGEALFNGALTQDNLDASGPVNGAFVKNGQTIGAGIMGNFRLMNGDSTWGAVGIFGGARTSLTPNG